MLYPVALSIVESAVEGTAPAGILKGQGAVADEPEKFSLYLFTRYNLSLRHGLVCAYHMRCLISLTIYACVAGDFLSAVGT